MRTRESLVMYSDCTTTNSRTNLARYDVRALGHMRDEIGQPGLLSMAILPVGLVVKCLICR
jgi:hypothetical protein